MAKNLETQTIMVDGEAVEFTVGSGNVFADLDRPDAELLQFKSGLIHEIRRIIEARGLSHGDAAALMKIDEAALRRLLRGRSMSISTDRLFAMLRHLGRDVEVRVGHEDKAFDAARLVLTV